MQSVVIMAFRKRMIKRGYRDVSIRLKKDEQGQYVVTALEPLAGQLVIVSMSIAAMHHHFRF